ncbi:MAG: hypothetical protein QW416_03390 [Candidatus Nitrosocaldaceae archaeon]
MQTYLVDTIIHALILDVESLTPAISDEEIDNARRELYKQTIYNARSRGDSIIRILN